MSADVPTDPPAADGYLQRATLLGELGRYDEAASELGFALALDPAAVEALIMLARVQLAAGRPTEALAAAESAVAAAPGQVPPLVARALALGDLERYAEAARTADEILALAPQDAYAQRSAAAILAGSRNGQLALNTAWHAVELAPDEPQGHLVLGLVAANMRMFDLAERAYREALRLDPRLAEVGDDVGVLRLEQRRWNTTLAQLADAAVGNLPPADPSGRPGTATPTGPDHDPRRSGLPGDGTSPPSGPRDDAAWPSGPPDSASWPSGPGDDLSRPSGPRDGASGPGDDVARPSGPGDGASWPSGGRDAASWPGEAGDDTSRPGGTPDAASGPGDDVSRSGAAGGAAYPGLTPDWPRHGPAGSPPGALGGGPVDAGQFTGPVTHRAVPAALRQLVVWGAGWSVVAAVVVACTAATGPGFSRLIAVLAAIGGGIVVWRQASRLPGLTRTVMPVLRRTDRTLALAVYAACAGPALILLYALFGSPWPLVLAIGAGTVAQLAIITRPVA